MTRGELTDLLIGRASSDAPVYLQTGSDDEVVDISEMVLSVQPDGTETVLLKG